MDTTKPPATQIVSECKKFMCSKSSTAHLWYVLQYESLNGMPFEDENHRMQILHM